MKKKLIFITEALWIGGIETALVNLLNRLDYDRDDVTCLILRDCQEMAYRITHVDKLHRFSSQIHKLPHKSEFGY